MDSFFHLHFTEVIFKIMQIITIIIILKKHHHHQKTKASQLYETNASG